MYLSSWLGAFFEFWSKILLKIVNEIISYWFRISIDQLDKKKMSKCTTIATYNIMIQKFKFNKIRDYS